jgi:hypothetical protein
MPTLLTPEEIAALADAGKEYSPRGPWEPWCVDADMVCPPPAEGVIVAYDRDDVIRWSSEILYELTGRIFPGRAKDYVGVTLPRGNACTPTICYCQTYHAISLYYRYPIVDVLTVTDVNGNTIDPANWKFVEPNYLVRTDSLYWDCCGFSAYCAVGAVPTSLARRAAAELACALERIDVDDNSACFPRGIKTITTAGGAIDLMSIREALVEGKYVRMPFVAQLLTMYPSKEARFVDIWSLDMDNVVL